MCGSLQVPKPKGLRRQEKSSSDSWKQFDQKESSNSTSTRRTVRPATPRPEFQNRQYTNHQCMTKILHFLPKDLGITEGYSNFSMEAFKTNVFIWRMFVSSSMKAAMHLGPNYLANLEVYKNTNFEEIQSLFNITQKLILEHSEEILNVNTIDSASLSHDQVIQWTKAKVRGYSDSLQSLGRMTDSKDAITTWEGQVEEFNMSSLLQNYWESMEKQFNSSGIFSKCFRHCRIFKATRMICDAGTCIREELENSKKKKGMVVQCNLTNPESNEDRNADKGFTSMIHDNLVHKLILMHQATKTPDAKSAVDKEWKKL